MTSWGGIYNLLWYCTLIQRTCVRFWPKSGTVSYGKLRVTLLSDTTEKNSIMKRKLEVNFDKQRSIAVSMINKTVISPKAIDTQARPITACI